MSQHNQPNDFPIGEQVIFLQGPSGALETITATPKESPYAITTIICHPHPQYQGTMHNKVVTTLHRCCRDLAIRTVRFNYRGVGHSDGEYGDGLGETDDLLSVIDWVKQVRPHDRLWLLGFSFGAGIVLRAAEQLSEQIDYLACIAPGYGGSYFPDFTPNTIPWSVIHGEQDELIAASDVTAWVNAIQHNPPHYSLLPEVDHFFHGKLVLLREQLDQLLQTHLSMSGEA